MAAKTYIIANSTRATTAAPVKYATGNTIRTMLQVSMGVNAPGRIIEWGCSFDAFAAALPGQVELFGTTVAATGLTAAVDTDIMPFGDANAPANASSLPFIVGTGNTGYTAGAACTEGSVANYRMFDAQLIAPTNQYVKQWPLGREPEFNGSTFIRVRMTFGATVNAYTYMIVEV